MIWFKFHIGDFVTHTSHLDNAEELAYRRLLDLYYMSEKPIPLAIDAVSRRVRLDAETVQTVLDEFFEKREDGYHNARCDAEIEKYNAKVQHNQMVGKMGGRPKNQPETQTVSEQNPKKIQIQNKKDISSAAPTGFDRFWAAWPKSPRKVGKAACQKRWQSLSLGAVTDSIVAHVESMKGSKQWLDGFEPAPLTYINQRRWEDSEPAAPMRRVL